MFLHWCHWLPGHFFHRVGRVVLCPPPPCPLLQPAFREILFTKTSSSSKTNKFVRCHFSDTHLKHNERETLPYLTHYYIFRNRAYENNVSAHRTCVVFAWQLTTTLRELVWQSRRKMPDADNLSQITRIHLPVLKMRDVHVYIRIYNTSSHISCKATVFMM
jgi:hypothetical protein